MRAVRQIDRALKNLYNIDSRHCAEQFLITDLLAPNHQKVASKDFEGALYIHQNPVTEPDSEPCVDLGIYLSQKVREQLETFQYWVRPWSIEQLRAFSVASEEVSHFHYLIYNLDRNRPVSEFELELQGEIDRFLLLFFSKPFGEKTSKATFHEVFEQLFFAYRLAHSLTEIQKQRYEEANNFAKRFFQKMRDHLVCERHIPVVLKHIRLFYQMDLDSKVAFLNRVRI